MDSWAVRGKGRKGRSSLVGSHWTVRKRKQGEQGEQGGGRQIVRAGGGRQNGEVGLGGGGIPFPLSTAFGAAAKLPRGVERAKLYGCMDGCTDAL